MLNRHSQVGQRFGNPVFVTGNSFCSKILVQSEELLLPVFLLGRVDIRNDADCPACLTGDQIKQPEMDMFADIFIVIHLPTVTFSQIRFRKIDQFSQFLIPARRTQTRIRIIQSGQPIFFAGFGDG